MALTLGNITFDCADAARLAVFWSAVLDRPVDDGANESFAALDRETSDRPSWLFIKVPEPKVAKNRLHVDFAADDRAAEVSRLIGLGATAVSEHDEWGIIWSVLRDPEGNEFCVGQSKS